MVLYISFSTLCSLGSSIPYRGLQALINQHIWQLLPYSHFGGQANTGINGNYTDTLSVVARDHYISKIQCILGLVGEYKEHCLAALDPYRLPDAVCHYGWMTHQKLWPPVAYL